MVCKQTFIKKQSKIADLWKLQEYYESRNETSKLANVIDKIEKLVNVDSADEKQSEDSASGYSNDNEHEENSVDQNLKQGSNGDEDEDVDGDVQGGYVEFNCNADENDDKNENDDDDENDDNKGNESNDKNNKTLKCY